MIDEVATAIQFEGDLYIFLRSGRVFRMYRNQITGEIEFRLMCNMIPA